MWRLILVVSLFLFTAVLEAQVDPGQEALGRPQSQSLEAFLSQLGRPEPPPDEAIRRRIAATDCRVKPLATKQLDFGDDRHFSLGIYLIQRSTSRGLMDADVLSVLEKREGAEKWLRAGPLGDTKWIDTDDSALFSDRMGSPFRSCFAKVEVPPAEIRRGRRGGRVQLPEGTLEFLAPVEVDKTAVLRLAVSERTFVELGRDRVAAWLLAQDANLESAGSRPDPRGQDDLPSSSQKASRETIRLWNDRDPLWQVDYLPRYTESSASNGGRRIFSSSGESARFPAAAGLRANAPENCPEQKVRMLALRAQPAGLGFEWKWRPLCGATIANQTNSITGPDGCFQRINPGVGLKILLANDNLVVRKPNRDDFDLKLEPADPLVFIDPGTTGDEALYAANAFIWSNEALEDFGALFPWLPSLVSKVELLQSDPQVSGCAARRRPKSILLPSQCPGVDGFVPKGLCGDVVIHELSHELLGSLVALTSDGRQHAIEDIRLDEALADFYAMTLRRDSFSGASEYGKSCQGDFKNLRLGLSGHRGENGILRALRQPEDADRDLVSRLGILAISYSNTSWTGFLDEFLDLAHDKMELPDCKVKEFCKIVQEQTGHCSFVCRKLGFTEGCPSGLTAILPEESQESCPPDTLANLQREAKQPFFEEVRFETAEPAAKMSLADWKKISLGNSREAFFTLSAARELVRLDGRGKAKALATDRMAPGFTLSRNGILQGWTMQGEALNVSANAADGQLEVARSGVLEGWNATGGDKQAKVIQADPRLEVVETNSRELKLAYWGTATPTLITHSWAKEVALETLRFGYDAGGKAVLSVADLGTRTMRTYRFEEGVPKEDEMALAIFPIDLPGILVRRQGRLDHVVEIPGSFCKAPPFVDFKDGHLMALTCDGILLRVDIHGENPQILDATALPGIVAPNRYVDPLQHGDLEGDNMQESVVGPLRSREGAETVERFYVIGLAAATDGKPAEIKPGYQTVGSASIVDHDGNGCAEVLMAANDHFSSFRATSCKKPPVEGQ